MEIINFEKAKAGNQLKAGKLSLPEKKREIIYL